MRYHYDENDVISLRVPHALYSNSIHKLYMQYNCNHPVYDRCTLFRLQTESGLKGLAVIQQRFIKENKSTFWGIVNPDLAMQIYINKNFKKFFDEHAGIMRLDESYPTVTVRQIMWALRMKPLKKERWETVFDHKDI